MEVGDDTKGPVLCFGETPFRKRPSIGIREGSVFFHLGSFRNEEDLDRFMNALSKVFNLRLPETEDE